MNSLKTKFSRESLEDKANEFVTEGRVNQKEFHSHAYHRFFEGYEERYTMDDDGKTHIDRVYVGDYYTPDCSESDRLYDKIFGLALYIVTVVIYVYCSIQRVWYNAYVPVEIAETVVLIALLWFLFPLVSHLRAGPKMIIRQFRDSSDLYRMGSRVCSYCIWALAITVLVSAVVKHTEFASGVFLSIGFAAAGFAMHMIYLKEDGRSYRVVHNEQKETKEGFTIEY